LKSFKPLFSLTLFLFAVFLFTSCKKDPYQLGLSLLPPTDTLAIQTSDTSTIIAFSVLQDSIRTDRATTNMLGSMVDPVFGKTTASFCSQFRLSTEDVDFGINPVLDSVVLMLRYQSIYGESNTLQNVKVYELNEEISSDSVYYSNHQFKTYPTLLADRTFQPNLTDSVKIYDGKVPPLLSLNLSNNTNYFGNKLLYAPSDVLSDNTKFVKFMNGLYIETSPVAANGGLISFNMGSAWTILMVYFKRQDTTGKVTDSLHYAFVITDKCARINTFSHDQYKDASPEFKNQVLNHDSSDGQHQLYLQGLAGVKIKIQLPYITDYAGSKKIAINNAVLVLKNFESESSYAPPAKLTLVKSDSAGRIAFLVDQNEGAAYFGGTYHASDKSYSFRITRHLQQILEGKTKNYDLYLLVNDPSSNVLIPNRFVGVGTNPWIPELTPARFQLQMVYTRLH
jgi:hypothetical protein